SPPLYLHSFPTRRSSDLGTLPTNCWGRLVNDLGLYPTSAIPNVERDSWTTRALTGPFWKDGLPRFSLLWLSEPDFSQHETGPGRSEEHTSELQSRSDLVC